MVVPSVDCVLPHALNERKASCRQKRGEHGERDSSGIRKRPTGLRLFAAERDETRAGSGYEHRAERATSGAAVERTAVEHGATPTAGERDGSEEDRPQLVEDRHDHRISERDRHRERNPVGVENDARPQITSTHAIQVRNDFDARPRDVALACDLP